MKTLSAVALGLAIGVGLAGCHLIADPPPPDITTVDGVWCGSPLHDASTTTFIDIHYGPDGTPLASPASCEVKQGTQITWRGPDGNPANFQIDFPSGPPGEGELASSPREGDGRQKVKIVASGPVGTYKYGIMANGKHIDPDVKIKPN